MKSNEKGQVHAVGAFWTVGELETSRIDVCLGEGREASASAGAR